MKDKAVTLEGLFRTNDWIRNDFKGFSFQRANKGKAKRKFFAMLNPYEPITKCGVLPLNLNKGDEIKDLDGLVLRVVDFGSAGLFGKDSWSWIWVGFYCVNGSFDKAVPEPPQQKL